IVSDTPLPGPEADEKFVKVAGAGGVGNLPDAGKGGEQGASGAEHVALDGLTEGEVLDAIREMLGPAAIGAAKKQQEKMAAGAQGAAPGGTGGAGGIDEKKAPEASAPAASPARQKTYQFGIGPAWQSFD